MTGQIIAGQDPLQAVHYQIMVVYMITAASMLTAVIAIIGTIRQSFTGAQQLR
ncbi:MAG: ABC transporter permease [bacterium]